MEDIVERLRNISGQPGDQGDVVLCTDAADEIERLRAEVERLRITDEEQTALVSAIGYHVFEGQVETLERMLERICPDDEEPKSL